MGGQVPWLSEEKGTQALQPPGADPHAGRCGRGASYRGPPIPMVGAVDQLVSRDAAQKATIRLQTSHIHAS